MVFIKIYGIYCVIAKGLEKPSQEYKIMKIARFISMLALAVLSQSSLLAHAKEMKLVCKFENQFNGEKVYSLAIDAHSNASKNYLNVPGQLTVSTEGRSKYLSGHSTALLEEYCRYTIRSHWKGAHTAFKIDGMKIWSDEKSPLYSIDETESEEYPSFLTSGWELAMPLPEKALDAKPDSKINKRKNWITRSKIAAGATAIVVGTGVVYGLAKHKSIVADPTEVERYSDEQIQFGKIVALKGKAPKQKDKINSIFSVSYWKALFSAGKSDYAKIAAYAAIGKTVWDNASKGIKFAKKAEDFVGKRLFCDEKVDLAKKFEENQVSI